MAEEIKDDDITPVEKAQIEGDDEGGDGIVDLNNLAQLAAKLLEQETGEDVRAIKLRILERIANESDIKPSRIPAPRNITEIGGYFNLMQEMRKEAKKEAMDESRIKEMINQTLTSILGLPAQQPKEY